MSTKQNHKRWRKEFNLACLKRDDYGCRVCGRRATMSDFTLDVHHIIPRKEMPNGGYVPSNGITLCFECHLEAEKRLTLLEKGPLAEDEYCPGALYETIGSSYEQAVKDSKELS